MNLELIKAKEEDKDFLFNLRKSTMVTHLEKMGIHLSDQEHISRINLHFEASHIIIKSSLRVGLLKCLETKGVIEILQLQVLPEFQGIGIGKQIINQILKRAQSTHKKVTLKVLKENPAQHLYKRIGFHITGEDQYEFYMEKKNV